MNSWVNSLIARIAPAMMGISGKQRLSILLYHRVLPQWDYMRPGDPTAEVFDWHLELLARHFNPISLSAALDCLENDSLPERSVCVTFDDGYADNESVALPVLEKWGVPATVFIASGYLNGGCMWNDSVLEAIRQCGQTELDLSDLDLERYCLATEDDRRESAHSILTSIKHHHPNLRQQVVDEICARTGLDSTGLMLTDDKVRELAARGIEIGCHTVDHPILTSISLEESAWQISQSKLAVEKLLNSECTLFAYPNGKFGKDYDLAHRDIVRDLGLRTALSTDWGVATRHTDRWQMPRFTPWDSNAIRFQLRLLGNCRNAV